jgi:hypothetical protein
MRLPAKKFMLIRINVDHYPYLVEFSGAIEIERLRGVRDMHDQVVEPGPVAIRLASDNARLVRVELDVEQMNRDAQLLRDIRGRSGNLFDIPLRGFPVI